MFRRLSGRRSTRSICTSATTSNCVSSTLFLSASFFLRVYIAQTELGLIPRTNKNLAQFDQDLLQYQLGYFIVPFDVIDQPDIDMREASMVLNVSALVSQFQEQGTLNRVQANAMIGIATKTLPCVTTLNNMLPKDVRVQLVAGHHRFAAHIHLSPAVQRRDLSWLVKLYSPGELWSVYGSRNILLSSLLHR